MSTIMSIGPADFNSNNTISTSGNIEAAMFIIMDYLNSTYSLQAADTVLEQSITNAETKEVQQFNQYLNTAGDSKNPFNPNSNINGSGIGNWIWQLQNLDSSSSNYSSEIGQISQLYTQANSQNQSIVKVMDGNNSTAQNTLSQNSQGQQGLMQTMSSINGVIGNLTRLIQG